VLGNSRALFVAGTIEMEDHMQNPLNSSRFHSSNNSSLDVLVRVVINSLPRPCSKRVYTMAIQHFMGYLQSQE
jgi:hypothetical protein